MRWAVEQRLNFIRARLREPGEVRRGDLIAEFGISLPQASVDLGLFAKRHPKAMVYDKTRKAYIRVN